MSEHVSCEALLTNTGEGSQLKCRQRNHSILRVWLHKSISRPSPAPFLTRHNIPSLLRCIVFTGLNVHWDWNRIRYSTDYPNLRLAHNRKCRLGLAPTHANQILFMYHRWAGVAAVVHASLHFGLTAQQYAKTDQLGIVLENARMRVGLMAWASLALIFLTSLRVVRRRAFELSYYTHFLPFTIASAPGDKVGTIAIRALG